MLTGRYRVAYADRQKKASLTMTQSHTNEADTEPEETGTHSANESATPAGDADREPGKPSARRGGATAWLALMIALGAAGGSGYLYWQQLDGSDDDPRVAELGAELDALGSRLEEALTALARPDDGAEALESIRSDISRLRQDLERAAAERDGLGDRLAGLSSRVESGQGERQDALGGVRSRIEGLERSVGERLERFEMRLERVDGQLDDAAVERGVRLTLTEIDSLLRFAENRLALGADRDTAVAAWRRAVSMIESLPQDRFGQLGETARDELARLEAYRPFDPRSEVQRLYSIAGEVAGWSESAAAERDVSDLGDQSAPAKPDDSEPGSRGWRDGLASAFDRLVQVEKVESAGLTRIERERAGAQLRMTLQGAALALARSNRALAEVLVTESVEIIERAFDPSEPAVRSALDWLKAFEPGSQPAPPELGETRGRVARLLGEPT